MKTLNSGCHYISGAVLALAATAGQSSEVLFLDGGYSEICSAAAKTVEHPEQVTITGSRLDVDGIKICSLAIAEDSHAEHLASGNYNNRGVIHFSKGNYAAALSDFQEAMRLQPELAVVHTNLGYTYVALQRWADAIAPLSRGIELGTEELAKAYYNRAIAQEETGHVTEAYRDYLKASELAPQWEEPKRELSRFSVRRR
jgi:tetratricopeptide (TPR) repeat protein